MLIRLIYASTAAESVTRERVGALLKVARLRNPLRDLTAMLVFDHQYVLQMLEGERQGVNQLFGKLVTGCHHSNLTMISRAEIQNRSDAACAIGFAQRRRPARRCCCATARPAASTAAALALIFELSDIAASVAAACASSVGSGVLRASPAG